jgi:hypothetical protein
MQAHRNRCVVRPIDNDHIVDQHDHNGHNRREGNLLMVETSHAHHRAATGKRDRMSEILGPHSLEKSASIGFRARVPAQALKLVSIVELCKGMK